jgi:hypothetical protein
MERSLGEPQNQSGRQGEVKTLDPTGTRTPIPRSSSQSLYRPSYSGSLYSYNTAYKLSFVCYVICGCTRFEDCTCRFSTCNARSEVLTAAVMKNTVFYDVTPCSLLEVLHSVFKVKAASIILY